MSDELERARRDVVEQARLLRHAPPSMHIVLYAALFRDIDNLEHVERTGKYLPNMEWEPQSDLGEVNQP